MKPPHEVEGPLLSPEVEAFIEHYGVRGMRWGVRKSRSARAKYPQSSESKKVQKLRERKAGQLSNKQLQTVNTRLNLEQNYSKLNPNAIKRGTVAAAAILSTVQLGVTAYNLATSPAGKAAIAAGRKAARGG